MIAAVAIIFIGPDKLPTMAKKLGEFLAKINTYRDRVMEELKTAAPSIPSEEIIGQLNQIRSMTKPSRYISNIVATATTSTAQANSNQQSDVIDVDSKVVKSTDPNGNLRSVTNRFEEGNLIWSVEDPRLN
jgi:Sec-independent protein translocase protein TatA